MSVEHHCILKIYSKESECDIDVNMGNKGSKKIKGYYHINTYQSKKKANLQELEYIKKNYGPWTAHNIELAPNIFTIKSGQDDRAKKRAEIRKNSRQNARNPPSPVQANSDSMCCSGISTGWPPVPRNSGMTARPWCLAAYASISCSV